MHDAMGNLLTPIIAIFTSVTCSKHNNSLGFWFLFRNVEIAEITNFALSVRLIVEHIVRFVIQDGAVALQKIKCVNRLFYQAAASLSKKMHAFLDLKDHRLTLEDAFRTGKVSMIKLAGVLGNDHPDIDFIVRNVIKDNEWLNYWIFIRPFLSASITGPLSPEEIEKADAFFEVLRIFKKHL